MVLQSPGIGILVHGLLGVERSGSFGSSVRGLGSRLFEVEGAFPKGPCAHIVYTLALK